MEDKLAGLLGMCRRAGRLTTGFDAVTALAAEGRAALILAATYRKKPARNCASPWNGRRRCPS